MREILLIFKELEAIRDNYKQDLQIFTAGSNEYNEIYLGEYARRTVDEFLAEAFQEYKNRKTPGKYAKAVGELVDRYFKK